MIIKVKTSKKTKVLFNFSFRSISKVSRKYNQMILIVDSNVYEYHTQAFDNAGTVIVVNGSEESKTLEKSQEIIEQLLHLGADKNSILIGVGGGVISDLTGFVASIYKRGIPFGFVPTTVLAAVDAAIGGKNGVNTGTIKNTIGTICQPDWLLYDYQFFKSLPREEFANGFAEVIKYGCICDSELFDYLEKYDLEYFVKSPVALQMIIQKCLMIKAKIISKDPNDFSIRKTLNFGHTVGHAIEKDLELKHGYAVSIGMVVASQLSTTKTGLQKDDVTRISKLLQKYELPVTAEAETNAVMALIANDKKKKGESIDFILLQSIGESEIKTISFTDIKKDLKKLLDGSNN